MTRILLSLLTLMCFLALPSNVHAQNPSCGVDEEDIRSACILSLLDKEIALINNARWRDQSYRDLISALLGRGQVDDAIALFDKFTSEDTLSMAIRAVGMALPHSIEDEAQIKMTLDLLTERAQNIAHKGSQEVALTYVAVAAANAALSDYANQTARKIETQYMRNKAYQEIAETLSGAGSADKAFLTLQNIEDHAFRNKAYAISAKALNKHGLVKQAVLATEQIDDPYIKANTLLAIMLNTPKTDKE